MNEQKQARRSRLIVGLKLCTQAYKEHEKSREGWELGAIAPTQLRLTAETLVMHPSLAITKRGILHFREF